MPVADESRPANEAGRLEAVRRYDVLDTPPDGAFDRITQLAARICDVPISTISIVDEDRIWFKSTQGIDVEQLDRDPGLCASAVIQYEPYVVTDARVDARALSNPLVRGELGLRFYAAVPLTTSGGHNLGTLNVIDVEPRELSPRQLDSLGDLASVVIDELELRLAAKSAVAMQTARETERFRDAVVAGLTHEMRTPLTILKGLANLDEVRGGMGGEEAAEIHQMQRRQILHLDWLVRQFLDYTILEGERTPAIERVPVDVVGIVEEACDVFHGNTIRLEVDDDVHQALVDPDRTRQIVMELVKNAVWFSHGQPVDVVVRRTEHGDVRVSVTDRGPGIAPDDVEHIFEKAYRGLNSTGTGLGLYVTKAFSEAQGGRIEVASAPGRGSTFSLLLPTRTAVAT